MSSMLNIDEVLQLIEDGRPEWVKSAEKEYNRLNMHVNGVNVPAYLDQMLSFENDEQYKVRENIATSNRYLFANLSRPIDKIFSATGGTSIYPKENKEKIMQHVQELRDGLSIKRWLQSTFSKRYYIDPNGLIVMEWSEARPTPTIKSITSIFNYKSNGRVVDWVIFQPEKDNKGGAYYRVIDEQKDVTYYVKKKSITIHEEFKNIYGRCPAIINSEIMHNELNRRDSIFADVIEIADHYLRTGSVKNIYENLHGFPIFWAYGAPCKQCHGEGTIINNEEVKTCPSCDGKGTTLKKDVTDVIQLKPPHEGQQKISPDVAGYVQPDLETWREQRTELDWLWQLCHFTLWGTSYKRDQETATATFIDAQPVNERLSIISESFEDLEQKISEFICIFYNQNDKDVSINWGKRFVLESPDAIWTKYISAKEKGANKITLDYLLTQFYQAEYANDKESLMTVQKLMKIEPFIHLTEKECKEIGITGLDYISKIYFGEWIRSIDDNYIFFTKLETLKKEFEVFINTKNQSNGKLQGSIEQEPAQE